MDFRTVLGRACTLVFRRFSASGGFLGDPDDHRADAPCLLLIGSEIPLGARVDDRLTVFVYLDSEGRLLATTRQAKLQLGEVAFLRVTDTTHFGAFVDWGLAKDLLVPFAVQTKALEVGMVEPIGLYVDDSGRLAGTMRVAELLDREPSSFALDTWIEGEAWRNDHEIGLFVIVARRFVGLLPIVEPHRLARGEPARFRVSQILPDGKFELSLRAHAHEELERDARRVLELLSRPRPPRLGDRSSPEEVRVAFGISKKAFKRAAGRLLKQGLAQLDPQGILIKPRP